MGNIERLNTVLPVRVTLSVSDFLVIFFPGFGKLATAILLNAFSIVCIDFTTASDVAVSRYNDRKTTYDYHELVCMYVCMHA